MEIIGKISPDIDSRGRPGFKVDMSARVYTGVAIFRR